MKLDLIFHKYLIDLFRIKLNLEFIFQLHEEYLQYVTSSNQAFLNKLRRDMNKKKLNIQNLKLLMYCFIQSSRFFLSSNKNCQR